nr:unnamed protein product [Callosobruchus chinensis]
MDIVGSSYMPGDPRLVQQIVCELKSQGIFDQFRKECIADVDTKPAYQNLRQRVESSVAAFLTQQNWCSDMNKNQVREQLRKSIYESGYLDMGVERIVDQVVNPKINTVFLPQVEEVVYRFLGVQKPVKEETKVTQKVELLNVDIVDLLPTDLEAVSPESVHSDTELDTADNSTLTASKTEEDESPPFEPLDPQVDPVSLNEENSVESHLSGFSGLQSHDSNHGISQMELTFQDSQVSQNSSDDRLSIVISEDTKMDVDLEPKIETFTGSETKTTNDVSSRDEHVAKSQEDRKYHKDKKFERKVEEKRRDEKRVRKSEDKRDEHNSDKKKEKSSDRKDKKGDKHVSKSSDKISKSISNSESKAREKDKYKERNLSSSKHTSEYKHKEVDKKGTARKGSDSNSKDEMNKRNDQKNSDKKDAQRKDSDKKSKSKYASPEKGDKLKKKEKEENYHKEKSDKEEKSKDKANRDKECKVKDTPEKDKEKSHREKSDKKKEPPVDKPDRSKDREKSTSSKSGSNHSSSNSNSKDKRKDKESSSRGSAKYKDKKDDDSKSKHRKDTKRDKQSGDDHYSFKDKTRNRRSTDRDSNDDNTERSRNTNVDNTVSTSSQKLSSDTGDTTSSGGGNNSGTSDKVESENSPKSPDDATSKAQSNEMEKVKYIKPKFASNLKEAMRIMKIRRQIAKLERQNQLSFVAIDSPFMNGVTGTEETREEDTEIIGKVKHCEKVLNIVLDRNDCAIKKAESKEATTIEDKNSLRNKEDADDKSGYLVDQQRFELQTKDLSKENWEALEARLAEEMSNVDCRSYDYCDDYDCSDSEAVISSEDSVAATVRKFDGNGEKDNTYSNVFLTNLETSDNSETEQENKELLQVAKESLLSENILNSTERTEIRNNINMPCVVGEGVMASPGQDTLGKSNDGVEVYQDISSHIKTDPTSAEDEVTTIQIAKSDIIEEIRFMEEVGDFVEVDESFLLNGQVILMEPPIATVEEIIVTAENSGPEDECRYLEMRTPRMKKKLANLYRRIGNLEADIEHCIKACQNNFAPSVEVRGTKRKFNAIVDVKNNNKHRDDEKVSGNGE